MPLTSLFVCVLALSVCVFVLRSVQIMFGFTRSRNSNFPYSATAWELIGIEERRRIIGAKGAGKNWVAQGPISAWTDQSAAGVVVSSALAGVQVAAPRTPEEVSDDPLPLVIAAPRTPDSVIRAGPLEGHRVPISACSRPDLPVPRNVRRGGFTSAQSAFDIHGISPLVDNLVMDREAASGRGTRARLIQTWTKFHNIIFGESTSVLPLTPHKMTAVASLFKAGAYRAYPNYVSAVRIMHIEAGHSWTEQLDLASKWLSRSVLRGIGPARQSCPFSMSRLMTLTCTQAPLVDKGPCWAVSAALLGSMFLLREIELASARVEHWEFSYDTQEVVWCLPMTKTDPQALGTTRAWSCLCGVRSLPCPYHLGVGAYSAYQSGCGGVGLGGPLRSYWTSAAIPYCDWYNPVEGFYGHDL